MKRIILMTLAALTLSSGVALADRDNRRGHDRRGDRWDRRDNHRVDRGRHNHVRYDRGRWDRGRVVHVNRSRPTFRNNTFYFDGGYSRVYRPPVVRYRYRNYYQRPAVLVENYDPVPGYVWVAGNWQWNGGEWIWVNGRYDIDVNYQYGY